MQDSVAVALHSTSEARALLHFALVGLTAGATEILSDVSLVLSAGAPTILLGPNGAGKTTLLKLAMRLMAPTRGQITTHAADNGRPLRSAFVFQRPVMLRRSTAANVAFALAAAGRPNDRDSIAPILDRVGLAHLAARPARTLSAGEQQRLALARALAREPNMLFLDEPTSSLDPHASKAIEDIIADIAGAGVKIVMATHDLGQARRLAGQIVFLAGGRLVEDAPAKRFFHAPATQAARRFLAGDLVLAP